MDNFHTFEDLPKDSLWRAKKSVGGSNLTRVQAPDDNLAKVRFGKDVFDVLRRKKLPGETIRQALERIILNAS